MPNREPRRFAPEWIADVPPGDTLREVLHERQMTGSELARRLGVSQKHVSCVMTGKSALTVPFALALERELEISAEFWLAREMHYRLALTRRNGGRHA